MFATIAGFISLGVWIYLLLARGAFWRIKRSIARGSVSGKISGLIAIIVPARNEAAVVGRSLRSLLDQTCSESLHIFLINDASTDSTAEIARQTAASAGKD